MHARAHASAHVSAHTQGGRGEQRGEEREDRKEERGDGDVCEENTFCKDFDPFNIFYTYVSL